MQKNVFFVTETDFFKAKRVLLLDFLVYSSCPICILIETCYCEEKICIKLVKLGC